MVIQNRQYLVSAQWYALPLLWLQVATSFLVFIEPAPTDVIGVGLFVLFFLAGLRVPESIRTGVVLFGVFLLANLLASMLTPDPVVTLRSNMIRMLMVINWFFFVCLIYENPKTVLDTIWKGYIFAVVMSVIVGVLGYFELMAPIERHMEFSHLEFNRVRAFFKDPNVYGPFLVPVALYAFSRMEVARGWSMVFYTGLFLFISYGILLGFSRGSWMNYFAATVVYTGLRLGTNQRAAENNRLLKTLGLLLLLFILLMVIALATDKIREMLELRFGIQYYDTMRGGRLSNHLLILNKALTHPLGIGAGMSEDYLYRAPHNIYLHVLIESGWVGAVAFYAFLAVTIQKGYRFCLQSTVIQRSYMVVFASTIGILLQSLFIDSTHWRHLYLLLAMLWGPALFWQDTVKDSRRPKVNSSGFRAQSGTAG